MDEFLPIFHPLIEADLHGAMARYEMASPGLGARFKRAFYANIDGLLVFPARHPIKVPPDIRWRVMKPFPYLILYAAEHGVLYVLSVQYAGRNPSTLHDIGSERRPI